MSEHITQQNRDMAQVLAKIVDDKAIWVAERKQAQPLETFRDALEPSDRNFYEALSVIKLSLSLSVKRHPHLRALFEMIST